MKIKNESGQGLIEYLILTALLAVTAMGIVRIMGHSVSARFTDITNALQGYESGRTTVERPEERHYRKKDMSDFMQGAVGRGQRD
ncbi:MAG: hypothetical protein A2Z20_10140 [Bdellovibrionales bacterium RBG_16_40_8]|nr:MAG: hypothetical protein A2Z20_10140 [Bdellovibrionales bacterium RBG_16_40_8]